MMKAAATAIGVGLGPGHPLARQDGHAGKSAGEVGTFGQPKATFAQLLGLAAAETRTDSRSAGPNQQPNEAATFATGVSTTREPVTNEARRSAPSAEESPNRPASSAQTSPSVKAMPGRPLGSEITSPSTKAIPDPPATVALTQPSTETASGQPVAPAVAPPEAKPAPGEAVENLGLATSRPSSTAPRSAAPASTVVAAAPARNADKGSELDSARNYALLHASLEQRPTRPAATASPRLATAEAPTRPPVPVASAAQNHEPAVGAQPLATKTDVSKPMAAGAATTPGAPHQSTAVARPTANAEHSPAAEMPAPRRASDELHAALDATLDAPVRGGEAGDARAALVARTRTTEVSAAPPATGTNTTAAHGASLEQHQRTSHGSFLEESTPTSPRPPAPAPAGRIQDSRGLADLGPLGAATAEKTGTADDGAPAGLPSSHGSAVSAPESAPAIAFHSNPIATASGQAESPPGKPQHVGRAPSLPTPASARPARRQEAGTPPQRPIPSMARPSTATLGTGDSAPLPSGPTGQDERTQTTASGPTLAATVQPSPAPTAREEPVAHERDGRSASRARVVQRPTAATDASGVTEPRPLPVAMAETATERNTFEQRPQAARVEPPAWRQAPRDADPAPTKASPRSPKGTSVAEPRAASATSGSASAPGIAPAVSTASRVSEDATAPARSQSPELPTPQARVSHRASERTPLPAEASVSNRPSLAKESISSRATAARETPAAQDAGQRAQDIPAEQSPHPAARTNAPRTPVRPAHSPKDDTGDTTKSGDPVATQAPSSPSSGTTASRTTAKPATPAGTAPSSATAFPHSTSPAVETVPTTDPGTDAPSSVDGLPPRTRDAHNDDEARVDQAGARQTPTMGAAAAPPAPSPAPTRAPLPQPEASAAVVATSAPSQPEQAKPRKDETRAHESTPSEARLVGLAQANLPSNPSAPSPHAPAKAEPLPASTATSHSVRLEAHASQPAPNSAAPVSPPLSAPAPSSTPFPTVSLPATVAAHLPALASAAQGDGSAPLLQHATEDPGLSMAVLPHAAHLSLSSSSGDLSLHVRVRDGSADVNVGGSMAAMFESKAPEVRTALATQGLGLGSFATDHQGQQGQGGGQPYAEPRPDPAPAARPQAPAHRGVTSIDAPVSGEGRIHVTA